MKPGIFHPYRRMPINMDDILIDRFIMCQLKWMNIFPVLLACNFLINFKLVFADWVIPINHLFHFDELFCLQPDHLFTIGHILPLTRFYLQRS